MTETLAAAHVDARLAVERAKSVLTRALIDSEKAPPMLAISMALTELSQIRTVEQVAAPEQPAVPVHHLSARHVEIVRHLADDASTDEIAGALFISPQTVKSHVQLLLKYLGVHHRAGAVGKAARLGIL